jgi:phosphopentomutase
MKRAAVVVVDACGVGALPDAAEYGDAGTNTLAHVAEAVGGLRLPTLERLGLGCILPLAGVAAVDEPAALYGRLGAQGPGKDSTAGHWELMGVVQPSAPPTFPQGFPPDVVALVAREAGRGVIGGEPSEGLAVLERHGARHLETGELILYTSQDSVLQLAAHVDRVPTDELYAICQRVRARTDVGRVIARPFTGAPGAFERTGGRRDLALPPPGRSYLDELAAAGVATHGVGKVPDLFAGRGIAHAHRAPDNATAMAVTGRLLRDLDSGLVFTNLIDTDQVHGHRKDVEGFHRALREVDAAVAHWLGLLRDGDLLILTADHGVDPAAPHTDHTREYAPLLAVGGRGRHDGALADVGATVHRWLTGRDADLPGEPFLADVREANSQGQRS